MSKAQYPPNFPLKHAQKDMAFALALAQSCGQALPVAAAANAQYEGLLESNGDDDFSAIMEAYD